LNEAGNCLDPSDESPPPKREHFLKKYDVIVIGSGPGGYVAAIRAGILGLKTALVEKDPFLGGTCLHRGCIPTKALLHTAHLYDEMKHAADHGLNTGKVEIDFPKTHSRKAGIVTRLSKGIESLMKKRKVEVFTGFGRLVDANTVSVKSEEGETSLSAKNIILATGSVPAHLPHIKPDHDKILDSDSILKLESIPKSLAVIGAGAVGVEFGSIFNSFGTEITIVEMLPRAVPGEDAEISTALEKTFKKKKISVMTSSQVKSAETTANGVKILIEKDGKETELTVEKLLVSIGRRPLTADIGLDTVGVVADDRGYVDVDEFMRTNIPNIYAIGDIVRTPWLAHVATAEGILAVDHLAGESVTPIEYKNTPACTYCSPEVASVGLTEADAKEQGFDVAVGKFPFAAIGKAQIVGETDGFVKIVSDKKYDEVLGVHIIGPKATELIGEACLGLRVETTVEEIVKTIHPHPTLSESMLEAAHSVYGETIHM
jgi:dihydrolipoamide dehydrogenase